MMSEPKSAARPIRKALVVGAGTMGSGIAAHLANVGVEVWLLDIVPPGAEDRNVIANQAIQRMLKATPATDPLNAGFMTPDCAARMHPGNVEDHLEQAVREADWIVEAVLENMAIKRALFDQIERWMRPETMVSSNTSTIPLKDMAEGRSPLFQRNFTIAHFFNPPRFMHLLEIVSGPDTDPEIVQTLCEFGDRMLGKNVIECKDTPAFLANRIGIYYMFRAITEALERDIPIEEADAVLGTPMGFPKDGIFGLLDLVGIGIVPLVTESLLRTLPADDLFRALDQQQGLALVNGILKDGRLGRKSPKGGFYRMATLADGTRQKQALRLKTDTYYPLEKPKLACVKAARREGPRAIFESGGVLSDYAWVVVRDTLLYAATLIPEIADDIVDVDAALRGGYNARWGPFQLLDQLGVEWFVNRVKADGLPVPQCLVLAANRSFYHVDNSCRVRLTFDFDKNWGNYAPLPARDGVLCLADVKLSGPPLVTHHSASLWDLGDGVTCLEFHSKMNTLDPSSLWVIHESLRWMRRHADRYRAMVLYNEATHFSLGANLGLVDAALHAVRQNRWAGKQVDAFIGQLVGALILQGQQVFSALRYAPFPVVGAPQGMALGGGCEILLHCDAIQASAETYMGLVETGVGLVPGWGGCVRYLERLQQLDTLPQGPMPAVRTAFLNIMLPQHGVSTSAQDALQKHWLRPAVDGVTANPDRVLADAKARALALAAQYQPPTAPVFRLPGPEGRAALNMAVDDFYRKGDANWHDVVVADALAEVLSGGETHSGREVSESDLLRLEREAFLSLLTTTQTGVRIAHTLKTGKPLREDPLPSPTPVDALRQSRAAVCLSPRAITGDLLTGRAIWQLRLMADVTALLLKRAGASS